MKHNSLKPTAERITTKIRKYFELNGNKIKTYKTSSNYLKKRRKIFIQKNKFNSENSQKRKIAKKAEEMK